MLAVIMRSIGVRSSAPTGDRLSGRGKDFDIRLRPHGRRSSTNGLQDHARDSAPVLLRSTATLIVVPDTLLAHWKLQITTHTSLPLNLLFIDENLRRPLPPSEELAELLVVLTSHRYILVTSGP